jgi:X-X-X-Leu-X-X-Gly heptad repeat protein
VIGGVVLVLATPAIGLKTGPPSTEQLPTDNQARQDAEEIDTAIGAGWEAPFILVASTPKGTITEEPRFRELARWQGELAEDPGVQAVIGPAQVSKKVVPLKKTTEELVDSDSKKGPLGELTQLGPKLADGEAGVAQIRSGLLDAAAGAGLLGTGSGRAEQGAEAIAAGLARAKTGGERAVDAIGRLADGSAQVTEGQGEAKAGALSIKLGISHVFKDLRGNALARARRIRAQLTNAAASDPALEAVAREAAALVEHLAINRNETKRLRGESQRLHAGEGKLLGANTRLQKGAETLSDAAGELPSGLEKLSSGAERLVTGLSQLRGGADALESKLSEGSGQAYPLQRGLHRASVKVEAALPTCTASSGASNGARQASSTRATSCSLRSTAPRPGNAAAPPPRSTSNAAARPPPSSSSPTTPSTRRARSPSTNASSAMPTSSKRAPGSTSG